MTPLLGTTGGGSGRGFGRGFKGAAAPAGPSAAPSNLSATPAYAGSSTTAQMSLSWTNGDATATTEVYNNTTSTLVTTVSAGTTSYTVTGLNSSTGYSFKVRHLKNAIYSVYTSNASNTTYDYYLNPQYTFQGTADNTAGNYSWTGSGYDKITVYADGYGSTLNGMASFNDYLSTSYVQFRVTVNWADSTSGTYTVPSGVTNLKLFMAGNQGTTSYNVYVPDLGDYYTMGGGGSGAAWGSTYSTSAGKTYSYGINVSGNGRAYVTQNSPSAPWYGDVGDDGSNFDGSTYAGYGGGARNPNSIKNGGSSSPLSYAPTQPDGSNPDLWVGGRGHIGMDKSGYSKGYPFGQGEYGYYMSGIIAIVENP